MLYHHLPPEFNNKPVRLNHEELANPLTVLTNFFGAWHLHEIRQHLSALTEIGLTKDNHHFDSPKLRDSLLWFYYNLENLIEAAWVIQQPKPRKGKSKSKKQKGSKA